MTDSISYQNSGYFIKLIVDYLDEKPELKPLYSNLPRIDNFDAQCIEKGKNYTLEKRAILVSELEKQYQKFEASDATLNNIKLLNNPNTFTITTGHQLNLFTGPLYFIYKIISTLNLCKELKAAYPQNNYVPIYWMATEDHDFEEINHFNFKEKKIYWNKETKGPVGRLATEDLQAVFEVFAKELGSGENANALKNLFEKAYLNHENLADATRYLANELFKKEGLVILDADSKVLKKIFIPVLKKELLEQISYHSVTQTISKLQNYDIQVNPREINLFYIENNLRERIILENGIFKINDTNIYFSEKELLEKLETNPENFSPNVILRPVYQEYILPNLCYIGGGGEIAYWLQFKAMFEAFQVPFPILLVRNSVVLATQKQLDKAKNLNLTMPDLFLKRVELLSKKTKQLSQFKIDFSDQKEYLKQQFENLNQIALHTDKSFVGAVQAQEKKQQKGLENLEKRLLKAEKRVHTNQLERIIVLQNELFPNQGLQERNRNFSEFYLEYGNTIIEKLLEKMKPLEKDFSVVLL